MSQSQWIHDLQWTSCIIIHTVGIAAHAQKEIQVLSVCIIKRVKMAKFTEHEVVPDVLSVAPASVAEVVWPSGAKAELGNVLTPTQVLESSRSKSNRLSWGTGYYNWFRREANFERLCESLIHLQIQDAPTVTWGAEDGAFYTIVMTGKPTHPPFPACGKAVYASCASG